MTKTSNKIVSKISSGTVHKVPSDIRDMLLREPKILEIWNSLTPLARNEWICWSTYVKQAKTRAEHILQIPSRLSRGQHRPCCWGGCPHRTDKKLSASQKFVFAKKVKK